MRAAALVLLALASYAAASTAGLRFQLVFLENIVEAPGDYPLEVHVSNTGVSAATVTVSSPKTNCPGETANVDPNTSRKFDVCYWMRLVAADYWPSYKTVLVESNRNVMVYAINKESFSNDGYYAIPTAELAYAYYISTYDAANIATQFGISATEDGTVISIELPDNQDLPAEVNYRGMRFTNGHKYTATLDQYETYLAQSRGDLTGAKIIANKPVAVFAGNVRNKDSSGSRDHLVTQLHATGDWGTTFALSPVPRDQNFGDVVRVLARRANTVFTINFAGNQQDPAIISLTSPGQFYEFTLNTPVVIQSNDNDKELQVTQMVRSQAGPRISDVADPALIQVVGQSQWLLEYISPSLRYSRNNQAYVVNRALLSVANNQRTNLRVNGGTVNTGNNAWTVINGIAMIWIDVSGFVSNRFTSITNNVRFSVIVYGASDRESYGFALGADLSNSKLIQPLPGVVTTEPPGGFKCQESYMTKDDLLDNDCDGRIDEERCDAVDNDGDGLIDEDCEGGATEAVGNSYVMMFMENNVDDNSNAESFLEIYLSGADVTATINYNITTELGTFDRTILPGQLDIFTDLPFSLQHVGSGIDNKAIIIMADNDIVVYGVNKQTWSTDAFLAFPTDVVGDDYYTAHYWPGTDLNEFAATPVVNDGTPTTVTVTMPINTDANGNVASSAVFGNQNIGAGQSITFTLAYGQTAQIQAASQNDNLNGARITSDKPISAFSGNVRARVEPLTSNSRDHLVHQLAPVDTWGSEFVTLPIPREVDIGDIFYITAAFPQTTVNVVLYGRDGSVQNLDPITLTNQGSFTELSVGNNQYARIQSSQPVQVFQFVKTTSDRVRDTADPAMMLVPPVEQWSQNYRLQTPRTGQLIPGTTDFEPFENFLMIAIADGSETGLRLDGNTFTTTWTRLGNTGYTAAVVQVAFGRHTLTHVDPDLYFEALMYGRFDRESFALPLGMRLQVRQCVETNMVEGDGVDNDCDGSVDEELCNNVDDDADGRVDEDCGQGVNAGTNFFVTYMENTVEYPKDIDLELYVASVGTSRTQVNVRVPLLDFPVYNTVSDLAAGQVQGYGFTYTLRNQGQGVTGNTIYVRTTSDVVVYGINKEKFSNDGFLVYPENSLGTDHYCVCWSPSTLNTEFAVVATSTSTTTVTITLPNQPNLAVQYNGNTYSAGQQFQVTLERFQVYQGQSEGDLTGTRVQSNQRVAVFSGNVRTLIDLSASRDHLVQQMIATGSYGSQFMVVPYPERTVGDVLKVVASEANTQVRVDGVLRGTIGAGQALQFDLNSNTRSVVTTTNPVMVAQFMKSQAGRDDPERADPSMFLVPAISNYINTATFITPVYSGGRVAGEDYVNYLTLVIANGQQGNVRFNGDALTNNVQWQQIGSSSYVTATWNIVSGRSHRVMTTNGAEFYGRLFGMADRESYAFPVGWSFN